MNLNLFLQYFKEIKENPTNPKKQLLSHFDFSQVYGAPHPMPKGYNEGLPRFYVNPIKSIEKHLDVV